MDQIQGSREFRMTFTIDGSRSDHKFGKKEDGEKEESGVEGEKDEFAHVCLFVFRLGFSCFLGIDNSLYDSLEIQPLGFVRNELS